MACTITVLQGLTLRAKEHTPHNAANNTTHLEEIAEVTYLCHICTLQTARRCWTEWTYPDIYRIVCVVVISTVSQLDDDIKTLLCYMNYSGDVSPVLFNLANYCPA